MCGDLNPGMCKYRHRTLGLEVKDWKGFAVLLVNRLCTYTLSAVFIDFLKRIHLSTPGMDKLLSAVPLGSSLDFTGTIGIITN